jgi:hypothetical protein
MGLGALFLLGWSRPSQEPDDPSVAAMGPQMPSFFSWNSG